MLSNEILTRKFQLLEAGRTIKDSSADELVKAYKETVKIRNKMSSSMYFNMLNEECHMLYDGCRYKGVTDEIMIELFKDLVPYEA